MTHTYKVGDKGKTRGGDDYEVTGIGRNRILVYRKFYAEEKVYFDDGTPAGFHGNGPGDFLIPPKRRIQGWVNVILAVGNAQRNAGRWILGADLLTDQKLQSGDVVSGVDVNFCDLPDGGCWVEFPGVVNFAIYKGPEQQREKNDV